MYELEQSEFHKALPLFDGCLQDPMMHAVIEGRSKGRAFLDDAADPRAALVCTGSECVYVAGGQGRGGFNQQLRQLIMTEVIPAHRSVGQEFLSLFSFPESYAEELEELFSDQLPLRTPLSTFSFDRDLFQARHGTFEGPEGSSVALKKLGKEELASPENEYVASEVLAYRGTIERFLRDGAGYCALDGENLVSWCYVQAYGHGSQTLDIWTAPTHRRQGLGTLVAAAVIEASLSDGYAPFWICDKANLASRKLAERLGFAYTGDICLVDIPFEPFSFYRALAQHFFLPQGEYRQAADAYERAFSVQQGDAEDYYHAAVAWAGTGEGDRALQYLQKAIDHGWKDTERAAGEPAFSALPVDSWRGLLD